MSNDRLRQEIRFELEQLRRVAQQAAQLSAVPAGERHPWDSAAAAKYVHDLALGLENLCKRRLAASGQSIPEGVDSHSKLLESFLNEPRLGGQLSDDLKLRLKKYARFRHRFVHGYGHEVNWEIVDEPLRLIPDTVAALAQVWEQWLKP